MSPFLGVTLDDCFIFHLAGYRSHAYTCKVSCIWEPFKNPLVVFEWTRMPTSFIRHYPNAPTPACLAFLEIRHALQLERDTLKTSWLTLFKSPGNRKRLRIILAIGLFSQWSSNGLVKSLVPTPSPPDGSFERYATT